MISSYESFSVVPEAQTGVTVDLKNTRIWVHRACTLDSSLSPAVKFIDRENNC